MRIYNTMSRSVEPFESIEPNKVGMYCCGPTVYNYAHIGNLRTYIFEDILRKVLEKDGYDVKHVMNITDVGHLTGDGDDGEDKMSKSAKKEGKSVWDIAAFYTKAFMDDINRLNIEPAKVICKATDHIADMIEVIKELERRGHTYTSDGNVYFSIDTIDDDINEKMGRGKNHFKEIKTVLQKSEEAIEIYLKEGLNAAQTKFN